jgi:dienelactone hydrolase
VQIARPIVLLLIVLSLVCVVRAQISPDQPLTGPGGQDYPHASLTATGPYWPPFRAGDDNFRYFILEPASPAPATAPVILFLHGFLANHQGVYGRWMQHLAQKGYIVVWVQYQSGLTPLWHYVKNAEIAWEDALNRLDKYWWESHVKPARDETGVMKTAVVGHSAGGWLAAVLAARSARGVNKSPNPLGLAIFEPGGKGLIPPDDFSRIPASTRMLIVLGDQDTVVCAGSAQSIWDKTSQIPAANKDFLLVRSDRRGKPEQLGNHHFPSSVDTYDTAAVDARDYYVTYKLSTAMASCAFSGQFCDVAFGHGSAEQTTLGLWSDGVPVIPMEFVANPAALTIAGCRR